MKQLTFGIYAVEITRHLPESLTIHTGRVWEIFTSPHIPTHLCEITPSYELEFIRVECEHHVTDEIHDELLSIDSEDTYMHVSTLQAWKCKELETYTPEYIQCNHWATEKEVYEAFRDMHQGNHTFQAGNFIGVSA